MKTLSVTLTADSKEFAIVKRCETLFEMLVNISYDADKHLL